MTLKTVGVFEDGGHERVGTCLGVEIGVGEKDRQDERGKDWSGRDGKHEKVSKIGNFWEWI